MEATCPSSEWALDGAAWRGVLLLGLLLQHLLLLLLGLHRLLLHPLPPLLLVLLLQQDQLLQEVQPLLEPPPELEPLELQGQQPGALPVGTLAEALSSEEICWYLGYTEKGLYVCFYLVFDCY